MKSILVACGTGMATSTLISQKLRSALEEQNISCSLSQCSLGEVAMNVANCDLLVTSMNIEQDFGIPCINGAPLITGLNASEKIDEIIEAIQS